MANVAHPAVIIGLGGTGKWILTYIKKSLLDTYGGVIPPTIQLLSFDTTSEKISRDGEAQEEDVKVGDVQLNSNSEFLYLGGNIKQICLDIRDKQEYPHIGSWLQAKTYLQANDDKAFDISGGAGQKRPFGRMSLFLDLQQNVQAKVSTKIVSAISSVISANRQHETVEIYIIGSLAGGTGAGTFIDVAHLARCYATQNSMKGKFAIRGFLALQNSFNSVIQVGKIQPQAFAAMRELDRFMYVFNQSYPIVYNPNNPTLRTSYGGSSSGKLFDSCFLLDANRDVNPLEGVKPKYGVYPTIADAITMLLDGSVGEAFVQHYVNVSNDTALTQSRLQKPVYSSLGAFTLILPVEDIIGSLSYRFMRELLVEHLLNVEEITTETGQTRYQWRYDGNVREEAHDFLRKPQSQSGTASTTFIQRVPELANLQRKEINVISNYGDLESAELLTWILPPESDHRGEALAKRVRDDLQMRLSNQVNTSDIENDDPVDAAGRIIQSVRRFREDYLGREVNGRKVGGQYQKALEECRDIHRDRYRDLLKEFITNLLNGSHPRSIEFQKDKQGKLGRAQAILEQLIFAHNEQVEFFDDIKAYRARQRYSVQANEEAALARTEMEDRKGEVSGFMGIGRILKDMSPAIKAQKAYLDAEQYAIDVEVSDLFFEYLQQTARGLLHQTQLLKAEIDKWIDTLIQGITNDGYDPGLLRTIYTINTRHQTEREEKQKNFKLVREYLTDPAYEDRLYAAQTQGKFDEALSQMVWELKEEAGKVVVELSGYTPIQKGQHAGRTPTERNFETLQAVARQYFEPLRDSLNIASRLIERYEPGRLARYLKDSCDSMVRFIANDKAGGDVSTTYFVCINQGEHLAYFNDFAIRLSSLSSSSYQSQVLESSNLYTCTVLATTDRFTSEGLHPYVTAEREYNQHGGDARLLHIFPAEVNAVHLEQQLRTINEERRRFSLRFTAMLEDLDLVRCFMRAYLYRFIRPDAVDSRTSCWNLYMHTHKRRTSNVIRLSQPNTNLDLLDALETFAFKKTDINNPTITIDFELLNKELDEREQQATDGDDSRLINMLEQLIELDVIPLRQDPDQNKRDLASVMRLLLDERINTLKQRLKHRGKAFDEEKLPLIDIRQYSSDAEENGNSKSVGAFAQVAASHSIEPSVVVTATQPVTSVVSTSTAVGDLSTIRRDLERVKAGKLTISGFARRLDVAIQGGLLSELRFDLEDYKNGDLTEDALIESVEVILNP